MPNPNLLTLREAAEYLGIPCATVAYLVQRGHVPAVQIGGRLRINKDAIDDRGRLYTTEDGSLKSFANPLTFSIGGELEVRRVGYGAMRLCGQPGNFGPYADWAGGERLLRRA